MSVIDIDYNQLERAEIALSGIQNGFPRAVLHALNRASNAFVTEAVKETRAKYRVKASDVRSALYPVRANMSTLMATIDAKGKRHSLGDYFISPRVPSGIMREAGIMGAVTKEQPKRIRNAFLIKRSRGYIPFMRDKETGAIWPIISPSLPQIIKNKETIQKAGKGATMRFAKQLDHEIIRLIMGLKRR